VKFSDSEYNEVLGIFQAESKEVINRLNNGLVQLEKDFRSKDIMKALLRDAHSLKGASRMIGFNNIQSLVHEFENVVQEFYDDNLVLTSDIIDVMYKAVDVVSNSVDNSILAKKEVVTNEVFETQERIQAVIKKASIDKGKDDFKNVVVKVSDDIISQKDVIENQFNEISMYLEKIPCDTQTSQISELFEKVAKLYSVFAESDLYEVKYPLEGVKIKLDFVKKLSNKLTKLEIQEIKEKLNEFYLGFKNLFLGNQEVLAEKISKLTKTSEVAEEIKQILFSMKSQDLIPVQVADEIIYILDYIQSKKVILEEQMFLMLKNSVDYCVNNDINADNTLVVQQLGVLKQLLELNYGELLSGLPSEIEYKGVDFKEATEIKTMSVSSAKLDNFVSQLGELMIAEMKFAKRVEGLKKLGSNLYGWYEQSLKSIEYLNFLSKKVNSNDKNAQIFIKKVLDIVEKQNKQVYESSGELTNFIRKSKEDSMRTNVLINEMESMIKKIRILPISTVFGAFPRMVRDISKEKGKEIELIIEGEEIGSDKKIIEEISTPLIHIIRNAIDHGIELTKEREKLGKKRVGTILLRAKQEENKVKIDIIDDGRGLNISKIKEKALTKGLLSEDEMAILSEDEIVNIIFWPGFTTEDTVTDISGRGIGLDVVKTKLAQLNGKINVTSEYKKGCCVSIEIPVALATLKVFLVEVASQVFAIPIPVIDAFVFRKKDEIQDNNGRLSILYDNKIIPLYYLSEILELSTQQRRDRETILIIEVDNLKRAIIVDKLLGDQDILQKKLPSPLYKLKNISGVTNLASGEVCLILNMSDVLKKATIKKSLPEIKKQDLIPIDIARYKDVLVVDDSSTSRMLVKRALAPEGINIVEAKSADEALIKLKDSHYDLIILDYEMPEMNGLDLLNILKTNEKYVDIPVLFLTSSINETVKDKTLSMGVEKFIQKQEFQPIEFVGLVKGILAKYHNR